MNNNTLSSQEIFLGSLLSSLGVILLLCIMYVSFKYSLCQRLMGICCGILCLLISALLAITVVGICILTGTIQFPDSLKEDMVEYAKRIAG